jgi:type II secretory pathway pseudopilin PulG
MTLVEVVAGLALLGTLLVSLLLTKAALARQRATADRRLAAVAACDQVLSDFRTANRQVPTHGGGVTDGGVRWRSERVGHKGIQNVTVDVIRVTVTGEHEDKPLAQVEIVQAPPGVK